MMRVSFVVALVIAVSLGLLYFLLVISPGFGFCFSVPVKRFAGKSSPEMTYFMFTWFYVDLGPDLQTFLRSS